MPFFKCSSGLVYFFHVPKCGGSTVENALLNKGFKLSFYDTAFWHHNDKKYYRSSPQHIKNENFNDLFAEDIFFYKFTVLRDPVSRLLSAYAHNRRKIGRIISLNKFLSRLEKNADSKNDYFSIRYDNHFVPSNRLVPDDCKIFYLENNMKDLEVELTNILQDQIDLSQRKNISKYKENASWSVKGLIKNLLFTESKQVHEISPETVSRIKILYNEDYERFNFK